MKIKVQKNIFEEKLVFSLRFSTSKISSIQAIQGALLVIKNGKAHLTTTNLNDYYYTTFSVETEEEGEVVFDHKKTIEFVALLGPGEIELVTKDNSLIISQGKNKGFFKTYTTKDFPEKPVVKGKEVVLDAENVEKLPLVLFSASKDETRPALTGVYFGSKSSSGEIVSTDGFRLSLLKTEKNKDWSSGIIIPAPVLYEAIKQTPPHTPISLTFSDEEKSICFNLGDTSIYSRVIEGEFPPYEKVIPKTHTTRVVVQKTELLRNTKLVSVFAREQGDIIIFHINKKGLLIKPKNVQGEETQVFMEPTEFEGEEMKIAFNHRFLVDFLNNVGFDDVVIELTQSTAPALFRDKKNNKYIHIIMPLRTEETTSD